MRPCRGWFRSTKTPGRSRPGAAGRIGAAPGARIEHIIAFVPYSAPARRSRTRIVWAARSMAVTTCSVCTSRLKRIAEQLPRGDQELSLIHDHVAHVVGQAAVGERHVRPPIEEDDLGPLVEPPESRRRGRSTRHAAHNQHASRHAPLHVFTARAL